MKNLHFPLLATCLLLSTFLFSQNTNIQQPTSVNADGAAPDASSILDVQATDKGMLTPRMTTAQRTAIATPATGLLVYDTDTGSFWFFEDNTWNEILTSTPPSVGGVTAPATPIPDCNPAGISSVINLTGTDTVAADTRFRVCMDITKNYTGDLDISLKAPDGTAIDLSSGNGNAGNFTGTCFTTEAVSPITGGLSPFSGNWQPEEPFSVFTGKAITGNWVLTVVDDDCFNTGGTLDGWSLHISQPATVATLLADADGDTRVSVEDLPDGDFIRLEAGGMAGLEVKPDSAAFKVPLRVTGNFVSGSSRNTASGLFSFAGGGVGNTASGSYVFVGGGINNTASFTMSYVGGGSYNISSGYGSFVGGGESNTASNFGSFVGGGLSNTASGQASFIGGGNGLTAESYSETVFGTFNTDYTPNSEIFSSSTDRLFVIGNGVASNRSNAVTVLKNGRVGIGSDTPTRTLDVEGELFVKEENGVAYFQSSTSNSFIALENNGGAAATNVGYFDNGTDDYFFVDTPGGSFGELRVGTNGKTGLGRTAATNRLEVDGNASKSSSGNWLANSDARLKKNIRPLDSEEILQKMLMLRGITYEWADDQTGSTRPEGTMYGFTAQNIQAVFPELVEEDNLGFLQTAYGTYDAMTVEAMRALKNENKKQQAEIEDLRSQLTEMDELKNQLSAVQANMVRLEALLTSPSEAPVGDE